MFVAPGCAGCDRAREIVQWVRRLRPHQPVDVVDLADPDARVPRAVVGTPTYVLGERVVSMGNPAFLDLLAALDSPVAREEYQ